jgi:hypothetical protein
MQLAAEPSDKNQASGGNDDPPARMNPKVGAEVYHDGLDSHGEPADPPQLSGAEMDEVGW